MSVGCPEIDELVKKWFKSDKNEKTTKQVQELVNKKDCGALRSRMCGKMVFGTAGIRSRVEAGYNRLNDLTVIMLTKGFSLHLKDVYKRESNGVAIGYDGRHDSRRWADLASNVFVQNGIKVFLFSEPCPTPLVSYATIRLKCDGGLMITASHNPKQDNGYKAYWTNGAQILAPHDVEICRLAYEHMEPDAKYWDLSKLHQNPLLQSADPVIEKYFAEEQCLCRYKPLNEKCPIKFTYSAFHGIGLKYAVRIMKNFGFPDENVIIVKEQANPDPEFPTVPFPNPEEGKAALKLSIETADRNSSTVILANDPDADRFQIAEKQPNGEWRIFTGNEMGALITWWIWKCWRAENPSANASNVYILNSAVSSSITKTVAAKEGFKNDLCLTGFKWMGNKSYELASQGKTVILAWEESIGFMPGHSLDKDGITAMGIFAELASYLLQKEGSSLNKQLFKLYKEYGFHLMRSSYWILPRQEVMKDIFIKLRKDQKFPTKIGKYDVKYVRDLTIGYDNEQPDNKPVLPLSTSSDMITFTLANGSLATVRASGTEPKIKYYIELKTEAGKDEKDLSSVLDELSKLEEMVVETLLEPKLNGLIARK